jgi:hypothetical protein
VAFGEHVVDRVRGPLSKSRRMADTNRHAMRRAEQIRIAPRFPVGKPPSVAGQLVERIL